MILGDLFRHVNPNITTMKHHLKIIIIAFLTICLISILQTCKKITEPDVTTDNVSAVTATTATSGGNVTNNGGAEVTTRGVCWGTTEKPTGNKTSDGSGNGHFPSNITGLTANTKYYVRAYATNSVGTGYGNEVSFSTNGNPPVAAFTVSTTTITAGQSVQFTDQSTNNPTSWNWNFGDGSASSTTQSPSHTYSIAGTYTVTLTATNSTGSDTETKTNYIKVNASGVAPIAAFTSSSTTIMAGQSVQFTDQSTNSPTSWSWNFGDGSANSTTQSPSHIYSTAGTYTVTLTATNSTGSDTETKTNYIKVNAAGVAPVAAFTSSSTTIMAGQSVQFTDQSTNSPTSWSWNFGDGSASSTTQSPSHTYSTIGSYTVILTVSNSYGSDGETKVSFITVLPLRITDVDNNTYGTVTIGSQVWMAENLKTTRFSDYNEIPLVTTNSGWTNLTTPGFCYYDNNESLYKVTYGALYNWYAVNNGKLCPSGWHVPSDEEWKTLEIYLGMSRTVADLMSYRGTNEGRKLKSTSGWDENGNGTNETGFTGLPGGLRDFDGVFYYIGTWTDFWTSTEINSNNAYTRGLGYIHDDIGRYEDSKKLGVSVRCIKNN